MKLSVRDASWVSKLQDPDPGVRVEAAQALGRLGAAPPEALEALARVLREDPDGAVRERAARVLGRLGPRSSPPGVVSALIRALRDPSPSVRAAAAGALGEMGAEVARPEVLSALLAALKDEAAEVRQAAAGALGRMRAARPEVTAALAEVLREDRSWQVREGAAGALGRRVAGVSDPNKCLQIQIQIQIQIRVRGSDSEVRGPRDPLGDRKGASPAGTRGRAKCPRREG